MTPPNWNHVDHELTRSVLEGKVSDEDSLYQAIVFADQCLQVDQHNEDVSHESFSARSKALEEAAVSFNEHDDIEEAVRELRRFWSV